MTPIYRKARKSVESAGKLKADFGQELTATTVEIVAVIQDDLLADALEIETNYLAFYKKCWESIIDTKQEKADDILTASPTP